jgi:uncharacterized protein YbaR (Trm112 family)
MILPFIIGREPPRIPNRNIHHSMQAAGRRFLSVTARTVGRQQPRFQQQQQQQQQAVASLQRRFADQRRVAPALLDLLACPLTNAPLEQKGEALISADIEVAFGIKHGDIANMVPSDGTLLSELRSVLPPPR